MVIYETIEEERCCPDIGRYVAYGIRAVNGSDGSILAVIGDAFRNEQEARALAERCTAGQLAVVHLRDVVEDALE